MDLAPTPSVPVPARPSHLRLYLTFGLVVLGGILIAIGLFSIRFQNQFANALFLPHDLHTGSFLVLEGKTTTAYRWGGWHYIPSGTNVLAADQQGNHIAVLTHAEGGPFDVLVDGKQVVSSVAPKTSVALSPDGKSVTYAELFSSITGSSTAAQSFANTASHWRVIVVDVLTGKQSIVGQGLAPLFAGNDSIIRFSTDGIFRTDLATGANIALDQTPITSTLTSTAKSPDGTLIMWTDLEKKTATVARISSNTLTPVHTYESVNALGDALGNTGLYWISPSAAGTIVWKYPFTASAPVKEYQFPKSFSVLSMTL